MDRPRYLLVCPPVAQRLWSWPWFRKRSRLERGVLTAIALTLAFGFALHETSHSFLRDPSQDVLIGIAGVGATFYIAYLVGMASLIREIKVRDGEREAYVGLLGGLGFCGLCGITIVFILAIDDRPLTWFAGFAFCCSAVSLLLLGSAVSALPLVAYDAARSAHINPDE